MEHLQESPKSEQPLGMPDICFGDIQKQVERILASATFARSPQLSRFLRYCVEKTLLGRPDQLREQILAVEVFRRPPEFEARRDPIVRVEARRLRSKLDEYYRTEGRTDPILISLQRGDYVARFAPAWRRDASSTSTESSRILIVEDERLVARDLETRLKQLGYQVVGSTTTGEAAVTLARELNPDLVLMDIVLAGRMTGTDAARRIRSQVGCPVVFLTAFSDAVILEDIKEAEPYGYVLKPFEPRQVHAVIQLAVGRRIRETQRDIERTTAITLTRALENAGICAWEWSITDPNAGWPEGVQHPEVHMLPNTTQTPEAFLDRVAPEDREQVRNAFSQAIESKDGLEVRYRVIRADGTVVPALALGSVVETSVDRMHIAGLEMAPAVAASTPEDIANRLDELEKVIAAASHDLQEPLRTIGTFTEMLAKRQYQADETSSTLMGQIEASVRRMRSLVVICSAIPPPAHHLRKTRRSALTSLWMLRSQTCRRRLPKRVRWSNAARFPVSTAMVLS